MYFSRISLRDVAQYSSDFWRVFPNPYTLHQSLWELFSDHAARKRDFLYRIQQIKGGLLVYAVSMREPDRKHNLWQVESKGYEPKINLGMQLVFLLRANPIRAKRDNDNKQHRHDVIMEAKALLRKRGEHKSLPLLLQEEGSNWLLSRAERCGFNVKPGFLRVDGYQQHHFTKGKDNKQVSFSTLDFNGALIVTDPNLFLETLFKGIGPAKAFGCGLMLVKRI